MCIHQHVKGENTTSENKTVLHLHMPISRSVSTTADAPLNDVKSKFYVPLAFKGKLLSPLANYQLSGQNICIVQIFVLQL